MKNHRAQEIVCGVLLNLACLAAVAQAPARTTPLPHAHAHNDYRHPRPLLDALDHGFCSVEADVWLVDGQLLVAHDRESVRKERTLEALYLGPLHERVATNGGQVYAGGPGITLLIDFKSDPTNTYPALLAALRPHAKMLTRFHAESTETNAVTIVISGNRPRKLEDTEAARYTGCDGRLVDLDTISSPHFMPLISDNWALHFKWRGIGPLPDNERSKLKSLVARTHEQGKRIRFWNSPDSPVAWAALLDAGVDLINTDNLDGLRDFCLASTRD
jgi:hypothetical protein